MEFLNYNYTKYAKEYNVYSFCRYIQNGTSNNNVYSGVVACIE